MDWKECLQNEPVFQVPVVPFAQLFIIKVVHGIFRAFLAAADTVRSDNKPRWQPARLQTLEDKLLGAGDYLSQALCHLPWLVFKEVISQSINAINLFPHQPL
ncbi:MAG: hypothetical protein MUD08_05115 [Cytophagales bacterium]|nr:hypothetical protein [Cytophagales bacterium]